MSFLKPVITLAERVAPEATGNAVRSAAKLSGEFVDTILPTNAAGMVKDGATHIQRFLTQSVFEKGRYFDGPVTAPVNVKTDLTSLFGPKRAAQVVRDEELHFNYPVATAAGKLHLKVMYNPKYATVHFHVPDTWTRGSALTFDMERTTLTAKRKFIVDDEDGIFHGLFNTAGFKHLAAETPSYGADAYAGRLWSMLASRTNAAKMWEAYSDASRFEAIGPKWSGVKPRFIGQAEFGVGPMSEPLGTFGLATCSALCISDAKAGLQYLAHVDALVPADQIARSISKFDLGKSPVHILPGALLHASALENTFAALRQFPNGVRNLKFLSSDEVGFRGIVMHSAQLYKPRLEQVH